MPDLDQIKQGEQAGIPVTGFDVAVLRAITDTMPVQPETARDFIRRTRDEDRY